MFRVSKSPSESLALTNCVIVNANEFPSVNAIIINGKFRFNIRREAAIAVGSIGLASFQRSWMQVSLSEQVNVEPFDPKTNLSSIGGIYLQVDFVKRSTETAQVFDTAKMAELVNNNFSGQIFSKGQPFVIDYAGFNLILTVQNIEGIDKDGRSDLESGILDSSSKIQFFPNPDSSIRLVGSIAEASVAYHPSIIAEDFNFQDMGIGGLGEEFAIIFRRAFMSRTTSPSLVKNLGMRHVKGILLYGPPGTGKTLMARQIAQMLNSREPKIVNGPEILNKYVGQSEENIRALFREAEAEYKAKGDASQLHVIIFDEIDAICKQRGNRADSTGVGDSVVTQLLSKMDGVDQLNNILLFGMTNRLDMIDEALMRPGRFELMIEIGLPNLKGRLEILLIHTATMTKNDLLGEDVDLEEIALQTPNFTGAELAGLVRSAVSFALSRKTTDSDTNKVKVSQDDFYLALKEVHPSYGLCKDDLSKKMPFGIVNYGHAYEEIYGEIKHIIQSFRSRNGDGLRSAVVDDGNSFVSKLLLHGPSQTGKTALVSKIALESEISFVKMVGPSSIADSTTSSKIDALKQTFADAHKSELSLIILDDLEWIIEWCGIGPVYSVPMVQCLKSLLSKAPPPGHRLLVIGTTASASRIRRLGIKMDSSLRFKPISDMESFEQVILRAHHDVSSDNRNLIISHMRELLKEGPRTSRLRVPIGKLLMILHFAGTDGEYVAQKFNESIKRYVR